MLHTWLIVPLIETAKIAIIGALLFGALMVNGHTRRVTFAVIKFTMRHAPRWAYPVMVAAALFPGQADEILLVAILLVPILRKPRNRRVLARSVSYAWKR